MAKSPGLALKGKGFPLVWSLKVLDCGLKVKVSPSGIMAKKKVLDWGLKVMGTPPGIMVKMLNCGLKVSNFVLSSCYYGHFQTNALEEGMKPFIPSAMG